MDSKETNKDKEKANSGEKKKYLIQTKKDEQKNKYSIGSKRVSQSPPKSSEKNLPKFEIKSKEKTDKTAVQKKPKLIASVFNDDSESEEEMPLECRMKMRNIGRDTITSAGPKSFNKGKDGFSNQTFKQFEMSMKPRNNMEKKNTYNGNE